MEIEGEGIVINRIQSPVRGRTHFAGRAENGENKPLRRQDVKDGPP